MKAQGIYIDISCRNDDLPQLIEEYSEQFNLSKADTVAEILRAYPKLIAYKLGFCGYSTQHPTQQKPEVYATAWEHLNQSISLNQFPLVLWIFVKHPEPKQERRGKTFFWTAVTLCELDWTSNIWKPPIHQQHKKYSSIGEKIEHNINDESYDKIFKNYLIEQFKYW